MSWNDEYDNWSPDASIHGHTIYREEEEEEQLLGRKIVRIFKYKKKGYE